MKLMLAAVVAITTVAAPAAFAQTMPAAPAAPAAAGKFTVDTPIETIAADAAGKAALEAIFPGMTAHPMYDAFKGMSLTQLQPMSQGQITDEQLAKAKDALAAIK